MNQRGRVAQLGLVLTALLALSSLFASANNDALRLAYHPEGNFTRVVLAAPGNRTYTATSSGKTLTIRLEPFTAARQQGLSNTPQVESWSLEPKKGYGVLTLQTRVQLGARNFKLFALPAADGLPTRIVADISSSSRASTVTLKPASTRAPQKPRA